MVLLVNIINLILTRSGQAKLDYNIHPLVYNNFITAACLLSVT